MVITDLKNQINRIINAIRTNKILGESIEILIENKDILQKKLNELLAKRGLLTEEDYNTSYEAIRKASEKSITKQRKKNKQNFVLIIAGIAALFVGIYLLKRYKK